jgi:hypothetical protein
MASRIGAVLTGVAGHRCGGRRSAAIAIGTGGGARGTTPDDGRLAGHPELVGDVLTASAQLVAAGTVSVASCSCEAAQEASSFSASAVGVPAAAV